MEAARAAFAEICSDKFAIELDEDEFELFVAYIEHVELDEFDHREWSEFEDTFVSPLR